MPAAPADSGGCGCFSVVAPQVNVMLEPRAGLVRLFRHPTTDHLLIPLTCPPRLRYVRVDPPQERDVCNARPKDLLPPLSSQRRFVKGSGSALTTRSLTSGRAPGRIRLVLLVGVFTSLLGSCAQKKPVPTGYFQTASDPSVRLTGRETFFVLIRADTEGRRATVQEKRERLAVERAFKTRGLTLADSRETAQLLIAVDSNVQSSEVEIQRIRPHNVSTWISSGHLRTTTVNESYSSSETVYTRRVYVDVFDAKSGEHVWEGYLGLSEGDFRKCPDGWIASLAKPFPGDVDGRAPRKYKCEKERRKR